MIIFYNKKTGNIVGTIDGRIHTENHFKMWVGNPKEIERIIINWKPAKWFDKEGKLCNKDDPNAFTADFEPDHLQKELFVEMDKDTSKIYDYKVDTKTKLLIAK